MAKADTPRAELCDLIANWLQRAKNVGISRKQICIGADLGETTFYNTYQSPDLRRKIIGNTERHLAVLHAFAEALCDQDQARPSVNQIIRFIQLCRLPADQLISIGEWWKLKPAEWQAALSAAGIEALPGSNMWASRNTAPIPAPLTLTQPPIEITVGHLTVGSAISDASDMLPNIAGQHSVVRDSPYHPVLFAPFQIPYPRSHRFIDREHELETLAQLLDDDALVTILPAIIGIGGVGKTLLAVEFAHRYRERFPGGIFWLTADDEASMHSQIAEYVGPKGLNLATFAAMSFQERIDAVCVAWKQPIRRLLIFDNLEDPGLLQLPLQLVSGGSRVLITTRRAVWQSLPIRPVLLEPLEPADSLQLLLKPRANYLSESWETMLRDEGDYTNATAVCEALGNLPLALELAGLYLARYQRVALAIYRSQVEAVATIHPSLNLLIDEGLPTRHVTSITATFEASYRRLNPNDAKDQRALLILHGASYCAPQPIPYRLVCRIAGRNPNDEAELQEIDDAVRRLSELGLIEDLRNDNVRLHRLLAAFVRGLLPVAGGERMSVVQALIVEVSELSERGELYRGVIYIDHLHHLLGNRTVEDEETAALSGTLGETLWEQGDYQHAQPLLEEALRGCEHLFGEQDVRTIQSAQRLGILLAAQGQYMIARAQLERVLALRVQTQGVDHVDIANVMHDLGDLALEEGNYIEARQRYEQALVVKERIHGPDHPSTAYTINALGNVALKEGNYGEARQRYEQARTIKERTQGLEHRFTARSIHALGDLALHEGNYAAARQHYEQALAIKVRTQGPNHPSIATTISALGEVARREGNYVEARRRYEQALAIEERTQGLDHPSTVTIIFALTGLALQEGDFSEARRRCEQALTIEERARGPNHPSTANAIFALGNLALEEGNYYAAHEHYQQALAIREKTWGLSHPSTADAIHALGNVALREGNYAAARQYYEQALAIKERTRGPDHPETSGLVRDLGDVALQEGNYATARYRYQQALTIRERTLGRDHPHTARTIHALGDVAVHEGLYMEACQHYQQALAIKEQKLGRNHPSTTVTLYALGDAAFHMADYAKARQYFEQALAIEEQTLGLNNISTMTTMQALGDVALQEGSNAEARQRYEEVFARAERVFGLNHPDMANIIYALGNLAFQERNYTEAREHYDQFRAINERMHGRNYPSTAAALHALGNVALQEGDYTEAQQRYEQALAIREQTQGQDRFDTAVTLFMLSITVAGQGDYTAALPLARRALMIYVRVFGLYNPANGQNWLGLATIQQSSILTTLPPLVRDAARRNDLQALQAALASLPHVEQQRTKAVLTIFHVLAQARMRGPEEIVAMLPDAILQALMSDSAHEFLSPTQNPLPEA